jgi:uncharacterized membrane protein HdeD (DUF308 family)
METKKNNNWWFLAVNGCIFILVGILLLFFTRETILTLIKYLGILLLGGGGIMLLAGINNIRKNTPAAMILLEAIASIGIGLALIFFPQPSLAVLLMLIGLWSIIIGIIQLVLIVNIKGVLANKNVLLVNGLLTIGLGILLLFNPFEWAVFMGKVVGICAALFGALLVYFSMAVRRMKG